MYNTANYLKHIFSFCITTYTFTVIWRPGRSWGCLVSWARGWWAGKTGPTLHLSLPTFCSILPYKVLTWVCGHTVSVLQPCSINILLQTLAPGPGCLLGCTPVMQCLSGWWTQDRDPCGYHHLYGVGTLGREFPSFKYMEHNLGWGLAWVPRGQAPLALQTRHSVQEALSEWKGLCIS